MPCEWFDASREENFHISSYLEREIEVDEQGLAYKVEELRAIIHDVTTVMRKLVALSFVKAGLEPEVYDDVVNLAASAHALVCHGTEKADSAETDTAAPEAVFDSLQEWLYEASVIWLVGIRNRDPHYN